jgi:hypothetical protein
MSHQELVDELQAIDAMFVQTASDAEFADGRLVLHGVGPTTLYFSDRPQRVVGHIGTAEFVAIWTEGDDSFAGNPPNAVLALVEQDLPEDFVFEIRSPSLADDALRYDATILEGSPPGHSGPCTLFIDPFGRPLTPVSVAGLRRRQGRRARRRLARAPQV